MDIVDEELHYRARHAMRLGQFAADDMEIMDDGLVYRSLGGAFGDEEPEMPPPPGIAPGRLRRHRRRSFGDIFMP